MLLKLRRDGHAGQLSPERHSIETMFFSEYKRRCGEFTRLSYESAGKEVKTGRISTPDRVLDSLTAANRPSLFGHS